MSAAFVLALALLLAPTPEPPPASPPASPPAPRAEAGPIFVDWTDEAGIDFVHQSAPEKKYLVESMAGGVALLDYDLDDDLDVYLVNSLTVDTRDEPESAPSALYRNRGDGTFEEVGKAAGVAFPGWGIGVCVADVDADGWPDLYVTGVERNRFYRNRGDGTFEERSETLGIAGGGWSAGCGFADYDRDGDLDLFVSRYVEIRFDELPVFGSEKTCQYRGIPVQCGPRGLPGLGDRLYRNDGEKGFTEVAEAAGVDDPNEYYGLGVAWLDVDEDGWLDLFVANDSGPNFLYLNRKDGTFQERAFPKGVAVSEDGAEQGGMGVAIGDYLNEGRFAIFVTNFAEEYNSLHRNQGDYFADVSFRSATAPKSMPLVGWGTSFLDFDNDGWLDLVAVNGHVYPQLATARLGASASYRQRKLLYRNRRDGTFEEVPAERVPPFAEERVSRGLATGDLDGDGRLDLVVNDLDGRAQVLLNVTPDPGHWLLVDLEGPPGNLDGIGAVVEVTAGGTTQSRVVRSGTSYLSQDDLRPHFGLGDATEAEVRVRWPDGTESVLEGAKADGRVVVRHRPVD